MQEVRLTPGKERMSGIDRVILGVILFVLVIGIWVYLWVPPSLFF